MSIMEYNGGDVIAMVGKNCVAIATDKRLGMQAVTVSTDFQRIFSMTDKILVGFPGLATDTQTLHEKLRLRVNMYNLKEEREIQPKTFSHLVSSTLYEKRFGPYFCEPVVAGLDKNNQPFICSFDLIGCPNTAKDFVVSGVSSENCFGMCEALYEEDLEPEDLFETISQALLNAVDRDPLSGWGAVVHILTPDKLITRHLKTRQD